MENINLEEYKREIKEIRKIFFKSPYTLIYETFLKFEYDKKDKEFFRENASEIVENIRTFSWGNYKPIEKEFTSKMLKKLIKEDNIKKLSPIDAISFFIEEFPEHIYALILSNTQSRRSRAGKEFEAIIELVLLNAGVSINSQANIGKEEFMKKGIGKLVDIVSPGIVEYLINKRNTVLISAKTTLRERWQEVPEEMSRTGAMEMFLVTLDENISKEVLNTLYEANIQIITTKSIKNNKYLDNPRVLNFEELINICLEKSKNWENFNYSKEEKKEKLKYEEKIKIKKDQ